LFVAHKIFPRPNPWKRHGREQEFNPHIKEKGLDSVGAESSSKDSLEVMDILV